MSAYVVTIVSLKNFAGASSRFFNCKACLMVIICLAKNQTPDRHRLCAGNRRLR